MSAALLALVLVAGPAAAHNLTVTPPGKEEAKTNWVGALDLNEKGKGLIDGGPDGSWRIAPAHAKGLNTACYALEDNPSAADIRGPGPNCPHGQ